jgi:hypothetical protein
MIQTIETNEAVERELPRALIKDLLPGETGS